MEDQQLLGERIARHGLADRSAATPAEAAARTTALQAQDNQAGRLGVRARSAVATEADVVRAIEADRTVARTWLMRGTIHLVAAADLGWLTRLIGPSIARKYRTRWRQLGLADDLLLRSLDLLPQVLGAGPLTRVEVAAQLAELGLAVDGSAPQVSAHLMLHAATVGLVCRGPDRGRLPSFALTGQWAPSAPGDAFGPSGDDALAELARRYFAAYSPATAADFGTWSGLAAARAVQLIRDELVPVDVAGRPGFRLGDAPEPARGLRLLPAFDNYLIGYRHRSAAVSDSVYPRVFLGGMIKPSVLLDGRVIGLWSLDRRRARVAVSVFEPVSDAVRDALEAEVADVGRFLGLELTCSLTLSPDS